MKNTIKFLSLFSLMLFSTNLTAQKGKIIKAISGINQIFNLANNFYDAYTFMSEKTSNKGYSRIAVTTNNSKSLQVYFNGEYVGKVNGNNSLGLEINPGRIRISVYDGNNPIIDKYESIAVGETYHFDATIVEKTKVEYVSTERVKTRRAKIVDPDGWTNVREGRGTNTKILFRIYDGTFFNVLVNSNSNWWYIITDDGQQGYMHKSRIKF